MIGNKGAQYIIQGLIEQKSRSLRKLSLKSIDLTDAGVKLISQSFDEKIQNLNLLKLDIGKDSRSYESWGQNKIHNIGAIALIKLIPSFFRDVNKLDLTANDIDYKAIGYLRYQMELNSYPVLLVLRLKQNKIGDIGCKILAQIMLSVKGKENLRELDLAENEISSSGFYHLSLALVIPSALQKLHLQNNKIMARGALLLSKIIEINKSITYLDVNNNQIQDQGIISIIQSLYINKTLLYIDISYNYLDNLRLLQKLNQHRSEKIKDFNGVKLFVNDKCFY